MCIACSRLSDSLDSGEDARAKGTRKVGGAVSSRFVFVFARSQFSGPDSEPETGSSVCVRCTPFGVGHFKYQSGVNCICFHKSVVVDLLWFKFSSRSTFIFPIFVMVMYDNEFKSKQRRVKFESRIKLNHDISFFLKNSLCLNL